MSRELFLLTPVHQQAVEQALQAPVEPAVPAVPPPEATPEQLRALDSAFVQHKEADQVAGLLATWAGTMLLCDLAQEHFHIPEDEQSEDDPTLRPNDRKK